MFNILNFPLLTTMHIKIWRLIPLVMEKWFYCQYGTSTCRMVNCFHLMNAFTDRINVLKFIFWQMYHIKWNCQLEYHSQFMLICHMFWVKTLTEVVHGNKIIQNFYITWCVDQKLGPKIYWVNEVQALVYFHLEC